jgi:hypothetical protein
MNSETPVTVSLTWAQLFILKCAAVEWLMQNSTSPNAPEVRRVLIEVADLLRPAIQSLADQQEPDPGAQGGKDAK